MRQLDLDILLHLNHAIEGYPYAVKLLRFLGDNPMPRLPIFGTLVGLWFSCRDVEKRCRILVGLLGVSIALVLSLLCQYALPVHIRPILDQHIDVANLTRWDISKLGKRIYSFPSDTAVLYFGIVYVIFRINKIAGVANYIWCFLTVGLCRIAMGVHYPSDILAGIFLPVLMVLLLGRTDFLRNRMVAAMKAFDQNGLVTNTAFVLFLLEAYSLFPGAQTLFANLVKMAVRGAA